MSDSHGLVSVEQAAELLGGSITADHVRSRLRRGSLDGERSEDGMWLVSQLSIERSLAEAPSCDSCGTPVTEYVIVKYPLHDRVEFELCADHAAKTALAYERRGNVWEVVTYPFQSEAWIKPTPRVG